MLGLEKENEVEEEACWGKLLPKEEEEIRVVQFVGVVLRCPPVVLRRGGGASMVGKMGELLLGLELEREGEGSE